VRRQQHRNHPERFVADALSQGRSHFSFSHGPRPFGPKNTAQVELLSKCFSQGFLAGFSGHQMPFTEKRADTFLFKPLGDDLTTALSALL